MTTVDPEGHEIRALHSLVDFKGKDVLEIGCGDGRMTWRYAEETRSVLGMDLVEDAIKKARADTPRRLRTKVRFQAGDITTDPLPKSKYDIAILSWSL